MKTRKAMLMLMSAGLLAACASNKPLQPHDWALDVQTASTREAHMRLAEHYEEVARTLDADAE